MKSEAKNHKKRPINRFLKSCRTKLRHLSYARRSIYTEEQSNAAITHFIQTGTAAAIGKVGSVECNAIYDYLKKDRSTSLKGADWGRHGFKLYNNAGVFPDTPDMYYKFCQAYEATLPDMDLLGIWFIKGESKVIKECCAKAQLMTLNALSPPFTSKTGTPWTKSLEGKNVLIIHPFTETIKSQYLKRESIWPQTPDTLPEFTLRTLKTPMAASIAPSPYQDWEKGLEALKSQMDEITYDVVLVGAGAWSLPLVAHAKARGKVGIHTGGATQIFFGIKGHRWEKSEAPEYYNEAWVRPNREETPESAHILEKACYW